MKKTITKEDMQKIVKKVNSIDSTKPREPLTRKQALEKVKLVRAELDRGDMGVKAACKKHDFKIHQWSYWKDLDAEFRGASSRATEFAVVSPTTESLESQVKKLRSELFLALQKVELVERENSKLRDAVISGILKD